MKILHFILRLFGWLVTILLQIAAAFLIIFIFSVIFPGSDSGSRLGWLALLLVIWLGYIIGFNLVGLAALKWAWREAELFARERILWTAIGAAIPLLILVVIGYRLPVGAEGTRFFDLVTNNWQPILAQASLFAGIVGFYAAGLKRWVTQTDTAPIP